MIAWILRPPATFGLIVAVGMIAGTGSTLAEDFGNLTKEERKLLLAAYAEIDAVDQIGRVCNELAPDYADRNQAIVAEFKASRSMDKAGDLIDRFTSWLNTKDANAQKILDLTLAMTRKAVHEAALKNPEQCESSFRDELFGTAFEKTAMLVEAFGLANGEASVDVLGSTPAASDTEPSHEKPTTAEISMPAAVGDRVKRLPGISWRVADGVRNADSGGAFCVWRCTVLQHADESFPWLIIHEAVPLSAAAAVDEILSRSKKDIIEQQEVEAGGFVSRMAMQPDNLVVRQVYIDDYGSDVDLRAMFALEKGGLSIVTEIFYPDGIKLLESSELALSHVMSTIQMDRETIIAGLADSEAASTIEAAGGEAPSADKVIYAETPSSSMNALTLAINYDDDARYLDKAVLDTEGPVIKRDDTTFYYVPPQPEGTLIEGIFKSSSGYSNAGVSVSKSETLVFNKNGRYTTSASSGVVGGFLASTGSSGKGEGSYRISGYTLELRSDDGKVETDVFFPYLSRTFWPGSHGPADEVNFINLGGRIMYRDDG